MGSARRASSDGGRSKHWLMSMVSACSTLLLVSCASAGPSPEPDEMNPASSPASSAQARVADGADIALVDLDDEDAVTTWTTVNDPVMGGMSSSRITFGNGGLMFSGTISLENSGGFASARSPEDPDIGRKAAGATALRVHAMGDGKTYLLKAGAAGQPWSYIQRFPTEAGVRRTYDLPIDGFQPVGMRLDPAPDAPATLDPASITHVAVYILDKQQGPFEITVSAIDATM